MLEFLYEKHIARDNETKTRRFENSYILFCYFIYICRKYLSQGRALRKN